MNNQEFDLSKKKVRFPNWKCGYFEEDVKEFIRRLKAGVEKEDTGGWILSKIDKLAGKNFI